MESGPDLESEDARLDKGLCRVKEKAAYMPPLCTSPSVWTPRDHRAFFRLSRLVVLNEGESSPPPRAVWLFGDNLAIFACHRWGRVLVQRGGDVARRSTQDNLPPLPPAKNHPAQRSAGPRLRAPV